MLSGRRRFEVHRVSEGYGLIPKGILVIVGEGDGMSWICEIHPAVMAQRDEMLPALAEFVQRGSPNSVLVPPS